MSDTSNPMPVGVSGLPKRKELKLWEVAVKCFHTEDGRRVDVEHATDAEFQAWIAAHGIPVDDEGFADWAFEDRVGVINHALYHGVPLRFAEEKSDETLRNSEVFDGSETASQANGA